MIDIRDENCCRLTEAAKFLPRGRSGKRVHVATLYRWSQRGIKGVKLETIRIGGTTYTSTEALQRFAERCSGSDTRREKQTPHRRRREIEQAERRLDELGI